MDRYNFEKLIDSKNTRVQMLGWFILGAVDFDRFMERIEEETAGGDEPTE